MAPQQGQDTFQNHGVFVGKHIGGYRGRRFAVRWHAPGAVLHQTVEEGQKSVGRFHQLGVCRHRTASPGTRMGPAALGPPPLFAGPSAKAFPPRPLAQLSSPRVPHPLSPLVALSLFACLLRSPPEEVRHRYFVPCSPSVARVSPDHRTHECTRIVTSRQVAFVPPWAILRS